MEFNFSSKPNRRYLLRIGCSITVVAISLVTARHFTSNGLVDAPFIWVLALIPGIAMLGVFYAIGMLIVEQKDEFLRMLVVRQFVIATGIAFSLATIWGFLLRFELVTEMNPLYVTFSWIIGFAFGGLVNRITQGAWGEMS